MMKAFLIILFSTMMIFAQSTKITSKYSNNPTLDAKILSIIKSLGLDKTFKTDDGDEKISFAVIDLSKPTPVLSGFNYEAFIYPASFYKAYVAASVLEQVEKGLYDLYAPYTAKFPNVVDKGKEIKYDPRPLLKDGDTVNINYLLDLMITRSDNSAANCLIDIAKRENINILLHRYNYFGSEVTRKYLSRRFEDSDYVKVPGTVTSALHAADFMYNIYKDSLSSFWVSRTLKTLLSRQLDNSKLQQGLPNNVMFAHKTGWYSSWTNDCGIVEASNAKYIIACFMPLNEEQAKPLMKTISEKVFDLMKNN